MKQVVYDNWYNLDVLRENIKRKTGGTFSINEAFRINAELFPKKIFINSFGKKTSYRSAHEKINRLSSSFKGLGIGKNSKAALICGDSEIFVLTYLAIIRAGGVTVPINTRLATSSGELEYILNHSESRLVILEEKFIPVLERIRDSLVHNPEIVVIGDALPGDTLSWEKLLHTGSKEYAFVDTSGDGQALQLYTSGTTGRPKGAMLSHGNCLAQMDQMSHIASYNQDDMVQSMLPFPHCAFICFVLSAFYAGAGLNIIFPFDPADCAGFATEHKTTVLAYVPAMAVMLLNHPGIEQYDLSSVRLFMYGAAPMPYNAILRMKKIWPWAEVQNIFGMTECSAAISTMQDEHALSKIGGVGRAVPGGSIRVVDGFGVDAAAGEVGEILYKGPNLMSGYFKNRDATEKVIRDGWYHTGDLGIIDDDNILKIVDRAKDMLIRGGENVYPAEVERVLYDLPAVRDCAVIGVPDERLGERTKAFIALKDGFTLKYEDVVEHCKKGLAIFKSPEIIEFIDEIPRTAMAKIDKIRLRTLPHDKEWKAWENR